MAIETASGGLKSSRIRGCARRITLTAQRVTALVEQAHPGVTHYPSGGSPDGELPHFWPMPILPVDGILIAAWRRSQQRSK
ncbi:hypothetical protein J8I87_02035 [Paraburkholderia sp. LEh10]|jgi:hypothetical protein|uniref:hypothetical protein n=1 Tax=Paraburkholderia sp. LEh10 TaxID=2821353 RepID=UPI001AE6F234|nr:hypothetical protein [Paraburkholderia sp. LEh10]MBP0588516.1 hypothetical protein [Paraburkholderia sp. LEh10]